MQKITLVIEVTREGMVLNLEQDGIGQHPDELACAAAFRKVINNAMHSFEKRFSEKPPSKIWTPGDLN